MFFHLIIWILPVSSSLCCTSHICQPLCTPCLPVWCTSWHILQVVDSAAVTACFPIYWALSWLVWCPRIPAFLYVFSWQLHILLWCFLFRFCPEFFSYHIKSFISFRLSNIALCDRPILFFFISAVIVWSFMPIMSCCFLVFCLIPCICIL